MALALQSGRARCKSSWLWRKIADAWCRRFLGGKASWYTRTSLPQVAPWNDWSQAPQARLLAQCLADQRWTPSMSFGEMCSTWDKQIHKTVAILSTPFNCKRAKREGQWALGTVELSTATFYTWVEDLRIWWRSCTSCQARSRRSPCGTWKITGVRW